MGNIQPELFSLFLWLCLWNSVEAFDLEKQTELFIGLGVGIGGGVGISGLILGALLVIIALLCRKHVGRQGKMTPRKRKLKPYYQELAESRHNSFTSRNPSWRQDNSPMSFENNTFTIEETSFSRRPPSTFLTNSDHPGSLSEKILSSSENRGSWFHHNQQNLPHGNQYVAKQQRLRDYHGKPPAIRSNLSENRHSQTTSKTDVDSIAKVHSWYCSRKMEENSSKRSTKSTQNVRVKDRSLTDQEMHKAEVDKYPQSKTEYNIPGNRDSFISVLSTGNISQFSLPRLSVRRSDNYVDVTGDDQYTFTSFPD